MIYTTYVLYSPSYKKIYVGESSNLIQRYYSHNFFGRDWTKRFRPWEMVYGEYYELRADTKKENVN